MTRFQALIITGRLEVRFHDNEQLLSEALNLQKHIAENDYVNLAICFGRVSELTKDSENDVSEYIQSIYDYIFEDKLLSEQAFQTAIETFERLNESLEKQLQSEREQEAEMEEEKLNLTLKDLDLSIRSFNCLKRAGKNTVRDLVAMSKWELMHVKNLGRKGFDEMISKLKELGFELRSKEDIEE